MCRTNMGLLQLLNDLPGVDIKNIYFDSDNVNRCRIYIGGQLISSTNRFVQDDPEHPLLWRAKLFKDDAFMLPLSKTNCSPFRVQVSLKDPDGVSPLIWVKTTMCMENKQKFPFETADGQTDCLHAVTSDVLGMGTANMLTLEKNSIEDRTFLSREEKRMYDQITNLDCAFRHVADNHFVRFFAHAFALSLPLIGTSDAVNIALKYETLPMKEALHGIWEDYKATPEFKSTLSY